MRPTTPRQLLAQAQTPALLVSDPLSIRFLTSLRLTAGLLLILPRRALLFVDARYTDAAERFAQGVTVREFGELGKVLEDVPVCGIEAEEVTVARLASWKTKYKNTKFVRTVGAVGAFRRQKTDTELRSLRRAHKITSELLRRVPSALRKNITEEGLARKLHQWALELGADGMAFDPIVGFGTHTGSPHHSPTSRSLKPGHIVQIDVGARVDGYCGDRSEVYFTAPPTPLQRRMYQTLCLARDRAMKAAKAGVTNHALDTIARDVLRKDGLDEAFTHALGHGVGLEVHEGITLSQKAPKTTLLSREVIAIEPGAYFPGRFGMRVEDMVFVE